MLKKRSIEDKILQAIQDTPVVVINGARQTGKSTLVKELIKKGILNQYITLDNTINLGALLSNPKEYLSNLPVGTVIDEIQKAPSVFSVIKEIVDEDRIPARFVLTGSANILMLPKITESLAGRSQIISINPFTQGELIDLKEDFIDRIFSKNIPLSVPIVSRKELQEMILKGGFPEVALHRKDGQRISDWLENYLNALLLRDVRDLANIEQIQSLPNLLSILAAQTGSMQNFATLANNSNLNLMTLRRYYELLKALFLITELQPYFANNMKKRFVKSPKVYLSDTGLVSSLLDLDISRLVNPITGNNQFGNLLENFVVNQLIRQKSWSKINPNIYYLRTNTGKEEIDIILENKAGQIFAIEIKATSSPIPSDWRHIKWLKENNSNFVGGMLLYTGTQVLQVEDNIWIAPISILWS
jgi:uncharacterized protein